MNDVRTTKNISITMPIAMVKDTERMAKRENRTMSELVREALRHYKARRIGTEHDDMQWVMRIIGEAKKNPMTPGELQAESEDLAVYGAHQAKKLGIKESDVVRLIHESRARRKA